MSRRLLYTDAPSVVCVCVGGGGGGGLHWVGLPPEPVSGFGAILLPGLRLVRAVEGVLGYVRRKQQGGGKRVRKSDRIWFDVSHL